MTYETDERETSFELTGTGKHKGTSVVVPKQDVARIAGDDDKKVKAELDRQFGFAHDRRLKAERTAAENKSKAGAG
jgi:hypothetical protein